MIVTAGRMYGGQLSTRDGESVVVDDLLFDDRTWRVRYLAVRLGRFFGREDALLSPGEIANAAGFSEALRTRLSLSELQAAPRLLSDPPVAKQGELEAARMIAWEAYWTGLLDRVSDAGDPHLRNTRAVTGHRVIGVDCEAGRIDNFVIDDQDWSIRYLVVRLGRLRADRRVMVDPHWVDAISWQDHSVWLDLPKQSIEQCDEFVATS